MTAPTMPGSARGHGLRRRAAAVAAALGTLTGRVRLDRALVVVALAAGMVLVLVETPIAAVAHDLPLLLAFGLALLHAGSIPLAAVRPHLAAPLSVAAAVGMQAASPGSSPAWPWWPVLIVTETLALFVVGLRVRWTAALLYWVLATGAPAILAGQLRPAEPDATSLNVVVFGGISGASLVVAVVLAEWGSIRAQLVRERRISATEASRRVVMEERARIARELHDVIAHSMSIITVQSSTARFRHPDYAPAAIAEFEEIGEKSRQALDEMRGLLAVLRGGEEAAPRAPQPDLADVAELVAEAERAGMRLRFDPLPAIDSALVADVTGLVAYRIVQEALSNAIRHAPGASVHVSGHRDGDVLRLEIENTAAPAAVAPVSPTGPEHGHGLVGMRERATSVGGTVEVGPTPDGGFRIRAVLPLKPPVGTS
ncbi:histidine kinase [Amnibacterium sp.]|uniref:sensor histidine kinase n=1 Tax=Amnibacterium sp. TaxID=1872496 RepID=UPI00261FC1CD|nr:histidine kinase [Amnibacterium sp.]